MFRNKLVQVEEIIESKTINQTIQKKVMPWETMFINNDVHFNTSPTLKASPNNIIVIASLVKNAPNLGGLSRTCEIFQAKQLIVDNLNILKDPIFKSLSVTSEKWVPILEKPKTELTNFMQELKQDGYTSKSSYIVLNCFLVLGLEQSNTSVSLTTFSFPKKCALLLGNNFFNNI